MSGKSHRLLSKHTFMTIFLCLSFLMCFNLFVSTHRLNTIFDFTFRIRSNIEGYIFNQNLTEHAIRSVTRISRVNVNVITNAIQNFTKIKTQTQLNKTRTVSNDSSFNSEGARKDACNGCFIHNFNYLINNDKICDTKNNVSAELIILIFTTHQDKLQRETIRKTWLTHSKNNTANVRYAFLLGEVSNKNLSKDISMEADIYGDIIKEDFVDAYVNLTYKTILAFRWATEYCSQAKFIMKTDDDMWINVPALLSSVKRNSEILQKGVGGMCYMTGAPIRDARSKWYASLKSYPNKKYPGFCAGPGYVTSMKVAKQIFEISKHTPFFHLEDVYISLCVKQLGLRLFPIKGFNNGKVKFDPCLYKSEKVVSSHQVPPKQLQQVWDKKC